MRWRTTFLMILAALSLAGLAGAADIIDVPGGTFVMSDEAGDDNEALKRVTVKPFRLMRTEVTNQSFAIFVKATGYTTDREREGWGWVWPAGKWIRREGAGWRHPHGPDDTIQGRHDHPVVQVSPMIPGPIAAGTDCVCRPKRSGSLRPAAPTEGAIRGETTHPGNRRPSAPISAACVVAAPMGRTAMLKPRPSAGSRRVLRHTESRRWPGLSGNGPRTGSPASPMRGRFAAAAGGITPTACGSATATVTGPNTAWIWSASAVPAMLYDRSISGTLNTIPQVPGLILWIWCIVLILLISKPFRIIWPRTLFPPCFSSW